jgi:hypothetical protein
MGCSGGNRGGVEEGGGGVRWGEGWEEQGWWEVGSGVYFVCCGDWGVVREVCSAESVLCERMWGRGEWCVDVWSRG